jgi:branched-chain amino acid transport system substrate-binding protein
MNTKRRTVLGMGLAGLGLCGAGLAHAQVKPPAGRKVVLGQSVPLTGAASEIGLAFAAGAKLYVDAFNARKNNPGWNFELRQLDDGYDAAKATANAKKLLEDGADVLFGFVGTASSDAGAAVAKAENAIFFGPFAASDTLRDAATLLCSMCAPAWPTRPSRWCATAPPWARPALPCWPKTTPWAARGLAAVNQAMSELKLPPLVGSAFVPVNSDKVDAAVASLFKAQPQAIIQVSLFNSTAAFIRKMRKAGYAGAFMNFSVVGIDPLFTALGKEIGGVVVSQVVPSPRSSATPIVKEYLAAIETSDQSPSYESLEGFIAAKALAEAVRRAGKGFDKGKLQASMTGMTDYDVGGFRINLRAGMRDSVRAIDLVTITPDGKIIR